METPTGTPLPANDDVEIVFCRRFFHRGLKRYIYAKPGKSFRFEIKKKKPKSA